MQSIASRADSVGVRVLLSARPERFRVRRRRSALRAASRCGQALCLLRYALRRNPQDLVTSPFIHEAKGYQASY